MERAHGERKILMTIVLNLGRGEKIIKLGLLGQGRTACQGEPGSRTIVEAEEGLLGRQSRAPLAKTIVSLHGDDGSILVGFGDLAHVDVVADRDDNCRVDGDGLGDGVGTKTYTNVNG